MEDPAQQTQQIEQERRQRAKRTLLVGGLLLAAALLVVFSPVFGRYPLDRFVVLLGLLAACVGASCVLLSGIELLRR